MFRQALTRQIPGFFKSLEELIERLAKVKYKMIKAQPQAEAIGDTPEQQIVQALSDKEYYWRSLGRLAAVTGLEKDALDAALTQLLKKNIVKPAFGERSIIFGLRERVDKK